MQQLTKWPPSAGLPRAADEARLEAALDHWRTALARANGGAETGLHDGCAEVVAAVFGNSPYLARSAAQDPIFFAELLRRGPDDLLETARRVNLADGSQAEVMRALRVAKRRVAMLTAVADISGIWPLEKVTATLSDFAELAIGEAARHLLRQGQAKDILPALDPANPEPGSGLIVFGMGKLGARELNFSSDVDLIVLFDPEAIAGGEPDDLHQYFVRLTRDMVKILSEPTKDGYVFRTDLRLRPDPSSTPVAMSVLAAEIYYESVGQNWERAAWIKARQVAGDTSAGDNFTKLIQPFIWRRNLDFAAIQDIHSIKRQIDAHRGGTGIKVAGHNIKLGRGGIREIEFFAQTQQLIWGGRDPSVRAAPTVAALDALVAAGHLEAPVAQDLREAYGFLRQLEHRLQMIDDQQTHSLPGGEDEIEAVATFLGYNGRATFEEALIRTLRTVENHYAELFEDAPSLTPTDGDGGNLSFTGAEDDPDTVKTLEFLGFGEPSRVIAAVRGWHHARYRATRSERARQILTELVPMLVAALGRTPDPDAAFVAFDKFLARLPAGVQLLAMFHANPHILGLVAEIMGSAPKLAEHLSRHPGILETLLDEGFYEPLPGATQLTQELTARLERAQFFEETLDEIRRWSNDYRFQIGVQALIGELGWDAAGKSLSDVAAAALSNLERAVEAQFAEIHGRIPGAELSILAMGKLGGREMNPSSDLDLVVIYDVPDGTTQSDGKRPLGPSQYYTRFTQRLIGAITAQTPEGKLYEVDMRLRPSGNAGPIATSLAAFKQYHEGSAWTWEHLALSRARVITGSETLRQRIVDTTWRALTQPRDPDVLVAEVHEMRNRIDKEFGTDFVWEVKYVRGGLVDVEFIIQYLQLRHAHQHPDVLSTNTRQALANLAAQGLLDDTDHRHLGRALDLWQSVQGILRLTMEGFFRPGREDEVPEALQTALARSAGCRDFAALEAEMSDTAAAVRTLYDKFIGGPAEIAKRDDNQGDAE